MILNAAAWQIWLQMARFWKTSTACMPPGTNTRRRVFLCRPPVCSVNRVASPMKLRPQSIGGSALPRSVDAAVTTSPVPQVCARLTPEFDIATSQCSTSGPCEPTYYVSCDFFSNDSELLRLVSHCKRFFRFRPRANNFFLIVKRPLVVEFAQG